MIKKILSLMLFTAGSVGVISLTTNTPALAATNFLGDACSGASADSQICKNKNNTNTQPMVKKIVNFMLYLVGILAVIMIIFGGIKFVSSAGDANKVNSAKNIILYSVIGLMVAIFSYAIVNWLVQIAT